MADAVGNARLTRIPGAGHLSPLERPDDVSEALLDFLAERSG
jgi:pimeloyl-ACP methyl ester carboxylesterase